MLVILGKAIEEDNGWFRLHDVFLVSDRPDYLAPSAWAVSRSFKFLTDKQKGRVRKIGDYGTIWVRIDIIPIYAKWISIHFKRKVEEAIHGYKLIKASFAGSCSSGRNGNSETSSLEGSREAENQRHDARSALRTREDYPQCQDGYLGERRLLPDPTSLLREGV